MSGDLDRNGHQPARGYSWPPFEPGNQAALVHGATSERHFGPLARNHRRRVLRRLGIRAADLDPAAKAYLEHYARLTAKIVLLDRWFDEVGILDDEGNPRPAMNLYVRVTNSALVALGKLERHLGPREGDPFEALEAHLVELRAGKVADAD